MKMKPQILLFFLGILLIPKIGLSQVDFNKTPDDDLGNFEDNFQNHFFEALKHKGVENYERSIKELKICLQITKEEAVVYYELGKNYVLLKNYGEAEEVLKQAIALDDDNEWYLDELYGVYDAINDYDKALKTVKQLVRFHPDYKEDLARLYVSHTKYRSALKVLDEIDEEYGVNDNRERLRNEIYNASGKDDDRIEYLEERVAINPKDERHYLNLIYRYSEQGDKKKAFNSAKELLKHIPKSQLVHLALYKFYLDNNDEQKAINSMKLALTSSKVRPEAKAMVLNDFVSFAQKNPQYEADLLAITTDVIEDKSGRTNSELGQYYLQQGDKENALKSFKNALEKDGSNYDAIKNIILLNIDLKEYADALNMSEEALEIFPAQPLLYLLNGVANNNLNRPKDALVSLELGVDYIIDDINMEIDFYKQLSIAHQLNNNISKSETFAKKAKALEDKQ